MSGEVPTIMDMPMEATIMDMPMEGFFDGADIVAEAMTSTSTTA